MDVNGTVAVNWIMVGLGNEVQSLGSASVTLLVDQPVISGFPVPAKFPYTAKFLAFVSPQPQMAVAEGHTPGKSGNPPSHGMRAR
jgi:hypothetical protein